MTDLFLDLFLKWHDQLAEKHRESIKEAKRLAEETLTPESAVEEEVWTKLWDKPLYANVRVETAERWANSIKKAMEKEGSWRTWGERPGEFDIHKRKPGSKRDCFRVRGKAARSFLDRCTLDPNNLDGEAAPCTIPLHRLYAIQEAAKFLCRRSGEQPGRPPFVDLPGAVKDRSLSEVVLELRDEFGWGWGTVTVLHALTDMGLAVKPDLHLTNTVQHLGLHSRDPLEINEYVRTLLSGLGTGWQPDISNNLRYVDKVLMEISRQGIIGMSSDQMAEDILDIQRRLDRIEERLGPAV